MSDATDLHARLEALETKLAKVRRDLAQLEAAQRQGLGAWLERVS